VTELVAKASRRSGFFRMILGDSKGRVDYDRAVQTYEALVEQHPGWIWLSTGLIETLREYSGRLSRLGDSAAAESLVRRALRKAEGLVGNPDAAFPCFHKALIDPFLGLASDLVARPPVPPSDVALAIRLARQALEWESTEYPFWNPPRRAHRTLGVAYCRAGDWTAAASAFENSMAQNGGGDARDWFFLAIVRQRQGDTAGARQWYERAVSWLGQNPTEARAPELHRFQAEAEQVLGWPPDRMPTAPRAREPLPPPSPLDTWDGPQRVARVGSERVVR
jgi:tetratricopeptide (TPR) repeat protein